MSKICRCCGLTKDAAEFHKRRRSSDGLQGECKSCRRGYAEATKEQMNAACCRYYDRNKELKQAKVAAYRRANPYRPQSYSARRRALKRESSVIKFTPEQLMSRWAYFGNKCWICGEQATQTDHVKPLSRGGPHILANLRPICTSCNLTKRDRWPYPTKKERAWPQQTTSRVN